MNTLELIPRDGAIAEKILHSSILAGNLSGRLYIRFNISGVTLYLMNGYLQPLGEYINNTFQPSHLGQFYRCEVERVLNYLFAYGLFTDVRKTAAEG